MRYQGKIVKWNAIKGFGFVRTNGDNKDIFFHVSNLKSRQIVPEIDDIVSYAINKDVKQRNQAIELEFVNEKLARQAAAKLNPALILLFVIFLGFILDRTLRNLLPLYVILIVAGANLLVFLMYFFDKNAAQKGQWRIQESTLHLFSMLGGWGGAHIAQKLLRHKHKKTSFMLVYWLTVVTSCVAVVLLALKTNLHS